MSDALLLQKDAEIERLKAANAAIRAKTIEECASVADKYWAREVASQIRALDQPDEGLPTAEDVRGILK